MKTVVCRTFGVAICTYFRANTGGQDPNIRFYARFASGLLLLWMLWAVSGCGCGKPPPVVVVGPVRIGEGIVGMAAKGMKREEVIRVLGEPLVSRDLNMDRYDIDPKRTDDYMPGIYADAGWLGDDTLGSLSFNFEEFGTQFAGELRVFFIIGDKGVMLSRGLTVKDVQKDAFRRRLGLSPRQVSLRRNSYYISMDNTPVAAVLEFSDEDHHLSRIFVAL